MHSNYPEMKKPETDFEKYMFHRSYSTYLKQRVDQQSVELERLHELDKSYDKLRIAHEKLERKHEKLTVSQNTSVNNYRKLIEGDMSKRFITQNTKRFIKMFAHAQTFEGFPKTINGLLKSFGTKEMLFSLLDSSTNSEYFKQFKTVNEVVLALYMTVEHESTWYKDQWISAEALVELINPDK